MANWSVGLLYRIDLNVDGFEEIMDAWLGDDSQKRKDMILANNFSIASI